MPDAPESLTLAGLVALCERLGFTVEVGLGRNVILTPEEARTAARCIDVAHLQYGKTAETIALREKLTGGGHV